VGGSVFAVRENEQGELQCQASSRSAKTNPGKYRFHLKAANGEIIAASQGYETRASAEKGIESVKANAADAKVVDLSEHEAAHN
jgi:uncharacterized protein YegP (UPF0339 family)